MLNRLSLSQQNRFRISSTPRFVEITAPHVESKDGNSHDESTGFNESVLKVNKHMRGNLKQLDRLASTKCPSGCLCSLQRLSKR